MVIQQAIEASRTPIDAAGQRLTVAVPSHEVLLFADPARLTQVFGNLLHNASKFTPPSGLISVTAEADGREVVVRVRDSGIGIPSNLLPRIFEMFTQGDQTLDRAQGGLGIGLTLVRRFVEMHDGSVQAFSEGPGRGSEFVVRLPTVLERPEALSQGPPIARVTPVPGRRILVVDDNHDAAKSLAMLLTMGGHETSTSFDGLGAIEAAASFRPDVIFLDIGLPKLSGFEVARRIRQEPWGKAMVLVAVTGWGQDESRLQTADAGFDGHLVKPVEYSTLVTLLTSLSRLGRAG
jgi:CheY-like chemotaxis protein